MHSPGGGEAAARCACVWKRLPPEVPFSLGLSEGVGMGGGGFRDAGQDVTKWQQVWEARGARARERESSWTRF